MGASRGSQGELVVSKKRFQGTPPGSIVTGVELRFRPRIGLDEAQDRIGRKSSG